MFLQMSHVEREVADVVMRCVNVIRPWIDVLVIECHLEETQL